MDWIQVTGRWKQLNANTAKRGKNIASDKNKSVEEREASKRAAPEKNDAKQEVKKALER